MRRLLKGLTAVLIISVIIFAAFSVSAAPEIDAEKTTELVNACMLVDGSTGTVIYESENCSLQIAPASTTKILTAVVILENCNVTDEVTVGPEVDVVGSKMGLVEGETLTVEDLLYGLMLPSGNDAALALAVHCSGSVEEFAVLMNKKAEELGMTNSHFITPNGLDTEDHYVTVEDMAKVTLYAMNIPEFMTIAGTKKYTVSTNKHSDLTVTNTNKLLYKADNDSADYTYQYTTGIKTGATPNAGSCVVASAEKDGMKLIALVYGAPSDKAQNKWKVARYLFDYGYENFTTMELTGFADAYTVTAEVNNAIQEDGSVGISRINCGGKIPEGTRVTVEKSKENEGEITAEFTPNGIVEAPVYEGDVVGKITYKFNGTVIFEGDAVALETALDETAQKELEETVSEIATKDIESKTENISSRQISKVLWWVLGPILVIAVALIVIMIIKAKGGFGKKSRTVEKPPYLNTTAMPIKRRNGSDGDKSKHGR